MKSLMFAARVVFVLGCGALVSPAAQATVSCTITASSMSGTYDPASNLDMQGSFTINCTRATKDSKNQTVWIGLNQTTSQAMSKAAPYPDSISYGIYTDSLRTTLWTNGATGGVAVPMTFSASSTAASATQPYYMRANSGQTDKAAGSYSDTIAVTMNLTSDTGPNLGSTTITSQATVPKTCTVDTTPVAYTVNYRAFQATAASDSTQGVNVSCSKGTQVSLSLDKANGVISPIGLSYGLAFGASSQTTSGTSGSNAAPLSFPLTLTIPAGQAGTCSAAVCSGSDTRTITITY